MESLQLPLPHGPAQTRSSTGRGGAISKCSPKLTPHSPPSKMLPEKTKEIYTKNFENVNQKIRQVIKKSILIHFQVYFFFPSLSI